MMNNPLVSIIVPCYNQAHFLNESLLSVLNQTYKHWECIIVNDGSPDNTETIAKQWCKKDDRFKYLKKENGGLSNARNTGIAMANGVYILPLDADDLLHPKNLENLVPVLKNESLEVVSSYTDFFENNITHKVGQLRPKSGIVHDILHVNQLIATSLYRKSAWEKVGGYDESMKKGFEDWEFWLRLLKDGSSYHIVSQVLFYYRKAKKSMLVTTINEDAERVKEYIIQKHRDIYIKDFNNCIKVFTHHLTTSRRKEQRLQQSLEYKIGKVLLKPYRMLQGVLTKK